MDFALAVTNISLGIFNTHPNEIIGILTKVAILIKKTPFQNLTLSKRQSNLINPRIL